MKLVLWIFSFVLLNYHCKSGQIWKRTTKDLKNQLMCGHFNIFDFRFSDTLHLHSRSQRFLVLHQRVTHFWTCSLWKLLICLFRCAREHFKAVPTFFIKFSFFHQMIALQKQWKKFFISSKKLFSFSRYSSFCSFFPPFPHFPDSKGQMEVE